ncbi:hypothetical protein LGM57_21205 [Burkholderia cepacia]|uniref:hypothetical protein n=1 Tax=Burkholderia cepacia TaxID=292 RepID=UPI001C94D825|nr:hypothetical protein [Burkholderia cepacia]MBY4802078.1 hypothetical protein [Burkholderia cepacia]MCA7978846.1 hypothetical protein [Burkholderia cepacia]MCA8320731.1 hypothetical protein [Burkholderia cepacia]MCA8331577.1 hypothetical protein [Burkholderia cepacia]
MNRDQVLSVLPSEDEYSAAPNYQKKVIVANLIGATLDQLDADHRDPDSWEAQHIAAAIGYLLADWYSAAITSSVKALAPSNERADPDSWVRTGDTVTTRALRDALGYAKGKPARNG